MSHPRTAIGIDFGTTNSAMAVYDSATGRARLVHDGDGETKTASAVFYAPNEVLVGTTAINRVLDGPPEAVAGRAILSVKRHLISPPWIAVPDRDPVRPVDVAGTILDKLRDDFRAHAGGADPADGVVLTCPAMFDGAERAKLAESANAAGFSTIELVEEPVAAAMAFARGGGKVGRGILVYDFGGGTFDVAFVARDEDDERFYVALEPAGDPSWGGDDMDMALYRYWDSVARAELGRPVSDSEDTVDLLFLAQCRRRKEMLSRSPHATFSTLLSEGTVFQSSIERETFNQLIEPVIERSVQMTVDMAERARARSYAVDTLLLVGGTSQVPLVERRLAEALPDVHIELWKHGDVAVALGAAYQAAEIWSRPPSRNGGAVRASALDSYREAVAAVAASAEFTGTALDDLRHRQHELAMTANEAATVEREVL